MSNNDNFEQEQLDSFQEPDLDDLYDMLQNDEMFGTEVEEKKKRIWMIFQICKVN